MNTHAEKKTENKNKAVAGSLLKSNGEPAVQFMDQRPEAIAQRKLQEAINHSPRAMQLKAYKAMADQYTTQSIQRKENKTGLPDNLKTGIENLSGYSMDDVKVHYNSNKPAQLQAYAYAQGTDIHVGTGQEKHLAHEAWHVVQQKQGKVRPTTQMKGMVNINDDAGLEQEANVMGAKALTLTTTQLRSLSHSPSINGSTQPVQRTIVPAMVTWGVTHVVKERGGSIFGSGNLQEEEIGPLGELTAGEVIVINDDDIFISRRGSNQEDEENRKEQGGEKPSIPWVRVLSIKGVNVTAKNVYVRAETVQIKPEKKKSEEFKPVRIKELLRWDENMDLAVQRMETEWILLGGNSNKPKTGDQCSGDTWNQLDEGADVAHELVNPEYRKPDISIGNYQRTFIAHYEGEEDQPIAVMMVEMRHEDEQSDVDHLYIRWLVGSPKRKGGGSLLVGIAKQIALEKAKGELRVESARSAEKWYSDQKFKTIYNSKHETLKDCGCKFMTWTGEQ